MRVLVTGFEPFGDHTVNPSQRIVEHLADDPTFHGHTAVLPTVFSRAGQRIVSLISELRPDRVLCLGVGNGGEIRLERIAVNVDDARMADNDGDRRAGVSIVDNGPMAYASSLPLDAMLAALQQHGIPSRISNHAGTYVCNHVFYQARHAVTSLGLSTECGFVHVPRIQPSACPDGLPLAVMREAIACCLGVGTAV